MIKTDLVSIIITTHNRMDVLPRAIESAIHQTYEHIEIIVVDDGSTDNTESLVIEYQTKHKNIFYIKNEVPQGANVARNKGIEFAKGSFIAGLDDDDEFINTRIEILLNASSEKYSFVSANDILVMDDTQIITKKPQIVTLQDMKKENIINNQVLVSKNKIQSIGGFDEALTASQDYDMWLRLILEYGDAFIVSTPLQKIYISNSVKRISTGSKKFSGYFNFYKKHKYIFNKDDKKVQLARLYRIRNKKISFYTLRVLFNFYTLKQYTRQYMIGDK